MARNRLVSFRLPEQLLAELDDVVSKSQNLYPHRSIAIREAIQLLLELEQLDKIAHNQIMEVIPS